MIVEYILLLTAFVFMLLKVVYMGPNQAFTQAGPKLGARVEKHLITGRGFSEEASRGANWKKKP